jgi:methionyl-tRNA formyltransferase
VCAVKAVANVDAGPVYLRRRIDLSKGSVEEILIQVSEIVFGMIPVIVRQNVAPVEQDGEPVTFRRRKPQESQMPREPKGPREVYDHIRMLVGEGYPRRTSSTAGTA